MFSCEVNEIINWFYNDYKDEVYKTHHVEADTKENLFKRVYSFERSSRYDNARHYRITNPDLRKEYENWKVYGVTIELYYGGGVVD